ncbi:MAG: HNH endonuclease [Synechococcus sp.]
MTSPAATCALCDRQVPKLTQHHLIPRSQHKYYRLKKGYSRERLNQTASLCPPCHKNVHVTLSEKDLAGSYNTIAKLQQHPEIRRFTAWVSTKRSNLRVTFRRRKR